MEELSAAIMDIHVNGIKADEGGNIKLLLLKDGAENIVLHSGMYLLFEVLTKGITAAIEPDNVSGFNAPYQRIIKQEIIKPEFIPQCSVEITNDKLQNIDYQPFDDFAKLFSNAVSSYNLKGSYEHSDKGKLDRSPLKLTCHDPRNIVGQAITIT